VDEKSGISAEVRERARGDGCLFTRCMFNVRMFNVHGGGVCYPLRADEKTREMFDSVLPVMAESLY